MKKNYSIIIIVFFAVILIFINFNSAAKTKFRTVLHSVNSHTMTSLSNGGIKTRKFFSFYSNIVNLKKQNDELSQKLMSMEVDRSKIEELGYENELLKKELGFVEKPEGKVLMPARIIGREPTSFLDYVIVDKGGDDGINKNMAVISGGVLVGQVSEVFDRQSRITLITSKDSLILAMLEKSRSKGMLRGGISGLVLENITQDIPFEAGENVVTSGLDGELESGILIGKTGKIQSSSSDLFTSISVEPIADLSRLELVFVVK